MLATLHARPAAGDRLRFDHLSDAELVCVRNASARLRRRLKIKTRDLDSATGAELVGALDRIRRIADQLDAEAYRRSRQANRGDALRSGSRETSEGGPTPEYVAYRERRDAQVNAWKLATDFDRRAKEWETARRTHEDAERAAGKAIGVELEQQFARDDGPEFLFVVSATRRYVREDGLSFGVGDDAGYLYSAVCRPATESEAAALVARREAARRRKEAGAKLAAIAERIRETGERPHGPEVAEGERLVWDGAESVIYGGGRWFTLGPEWIWSIANNGSDGGDWSVNNVRTGGAGAVGWRVAATAELAAEIRSLFKIVGGDS